MSTCLGLLKAGDHIVSSRSVFGTTVNLFNKILSKFDVETSYVPLSDYAAWESAITKKTRLLYLETPSNPLTEIADIQRLADIAHQYGCLLVVDNCFCTPALQRPFRFGADVVIHSATKYLGRSGTLRRRRRAGQRRTAGGERVQRPQVWRSDNESV